MKGITFQTGIEKVLNADAPGKKPQDSQGISFSGMLKNSLDDVDRLQKEADQAVQELASGNGKDIHNVMIALEKAEISFQLMMQVRNKIINAYETIMRMQV